MPSWGHTDGECGGNCPLCWQERADKEAGQPRKRVAYAPHLSESNEHGTPAYIVEAARAWMGGIDLDPASSARFNTVVRASRWYGAGSPWCTNGFTTGWEGRVFLNCPGGKCDDQGRLVIMRRGDRGPCTETGECGLAPGHTHEGVQSSTRAWWGKLFREFRRGLVTEAVWVGFSLDSLQPRRGATAAQDPADFPVCIIDHRLRFTKPTAEGGLVPQGAPVHGNFVAGLTNRYSRLAPFASAFQPHGRIMVPYSLVDP